MDTGRWNWRLSGHCRLASLASTWLLAMTSPLLGALIWPIGALRMAASMAQLVLNLRLGQREPLPRRDLADRALFAATFLGSCAYSALQRQYGGAWSPLLLVIVLVPFSAIQLRMCARSYVAFAQKGERANPLLVETQIHERAQAA
ncbi:MAG: hypothetical protein ACM3S1_16950 [Hyphomicrobiales bacterium]